MNGNERVIDITEAARRIFGDIVSSATQRLGYGYMDNAAEDGTIDLKYGEVLIEFTNGKRVSFYTSEWGAIQEGE